MTGDSSPSPRFSSILTFTASCAALAVGTMPAVAIERGAAEPDRSAARDFAPHLPICDESGLSVHASRSRVYPNVVEIAVVNDTGASCITDRFPTVTFGDLDGSAMPVPPVDSGPNVLVPGEEGFAALWTVSESDLDEARVVDHVAVAAHPSHEGTVFKAGELGFPEGVYVYDPATTWWLVSKERAEEILFDHMP